jgi:integrase
MGRRPAADTVRYGPVSVRPSKDRWRVYWQEGGKQHEHRCGTASEAHQIAAAEALRIGAPGEAVQPHVTIGALASSWMAEPNTWGVRHRDKMRSVVRTYLIPAVGTRRASTMTPLYWQRVLDQVAAKGMSSSTVNGVLQAMRGVVMYGRQRGVWGQTEDPLVGVRAPRRAQDPFELVPPELVPTPAQVAALAGAMDRDIDSLLVRFAAGTGLRWGEAIAVRPCDVSLQERRVQVLRQVGEGDSGALEIRPPKTSAGVRWAPIPRDLVDDLAATLDGLDGDQLVFSTVRGRTLRRSNWNRRSWQPAHEAAGWPAGMTFHSLRHHAATQWLARGVTLEDASRMLGHSNPRFTHARYVGADSDHLDRALSIL